MLGLFLPLRFCSFSSFLIYFSKLAVIFKYCYQSYFLIWKLPAPVAPHSQRRALIFLSHWAQYWLCHRYHVRFCFLIVYMLQVGVCSCVCVRERMCVCVFSCRSTLGSVCQMTPALYFLKQLATEARLTGLWTPGISLPSAGSLSVHPHAWVLNWALHAHAANILFPELSSQPLTFFSCGKNTSRQQKFTNSVISKCI